MEVETLVVAVVVHVQWEEDKINLLTIMIMNKIILATISLFAISATAQETYQSAIITDKDLNGTARYVGMGGAVDALGADISTISSNPAGIGMFRKSGISLSAGLQIVEGNGDPGILGGKKTTASFDQIGIVYAARLNQKSFLNFAFNYHKSKNFNQILSTEGFLDNASLSKYAYIEGSTCLNNDIYNCYDKYIDRYGRIDNDFRHVNHGANQSTTLYNNTLNGTVYKHLGLYLTDYYNAHSYDVMKVSDGYIGNFDFNISGNINDRLYLGLTIGVKNVDYRSLSSYIENMNVGGNVEIADERRIKGTGVDLTFGAIWRPVEYSPFRIGLSIATPTWYTLTSSNNTTLYNNTKYGYNSESNSWYDYDFKLFTPWRFGISLGHTFGKYLAIGAGYEYQDYSSLSNRVIENGYTYYDEFGYRHNGSSSYTDNAMNEHTSRTLKGVSTFKIGAESKLSDEFAIRLGYNYLSPKYKMNGTKDTWIDSWGTDCSSQCDYVNWKDTHRVTFGIGYAYKSFSFDVAYQYSSVKGEYHPFADMTLDNPDPQLLPEYALKEIISDESGTYIPNYANATEVTNNRHQIIFTLGFKF